MKSQQSQPIKYPRFIQNKPCGIDKFEGGSQERLAKTMAHHFRQNDSFVKKMLYRELSALRVFGDRKNPMSLECWKKSCLINIISLNRMHGDTKKICNDAQYWN